MFVCAAGTTFFSSPVTDRRRTLRQSQSGNNRIRYVANDGVTIQAFFGTSTAGATDGAFADAAFNVPHGIAIDPATGSVFVADLANHVVRQVALYLPVCLSVESAQTFATENAHRHWCPPWPALPALRVMWTPSERLRDSTGLLVWSWTPRAQSCSLVTATGSFVRLTCPPGKCRRSAGMAPSSAAMIHFQTPSRGVCPSTAQPAMQCSAAISLESSALATCSTWLMLRAVVDASRSPQRAVSRSHTASSALCLQAIAQCVRQVSLADGSVTTLVGKPGTTEAVDGSAVDATFFTPVRMAVVMCCARRVQPADHTHGYDRSRLRSMRPEDSCSCLVRSPGHLLIAFTGQLWS